MQVSPSCSFCFLAPPTLIFNVTYTILSHLHFTPGKLYFLRVREHDQIVVKSVTEVMCVYQSGSEIYGHPWKVQTKLLKSQMRHYAIQMVM